MKQTILLSLLFLTLTGYAVDPGVFVHGNGICGQNGRVRNSIPSPVTEDSSFVKNDLVVNGWYQQNGQVIWGFYHNSSFWGGLRTKESKEWYSTVKIEGPCITRRAPGEIGPLLTEDLDSLSSSLKQYGFPGLEHYYGLWYDRRRDAHDIGQRKDANVIGPFLELPWARSEIPGASDGLNKYDLTRFNPWYFKRSAEFAGLCDEKGLVFFFNFYQQHMLIESRAHFEDSPWRPFNNIQNLSLPNTTPAANAFYALATPLQRKIHRLYIRKCLDDLGRFRNVVFSLSQEYTGPRDFVEFWLDIISEWEQENGRKVNVALGATKDVTDALLADPKRAGMIGTIDMSRWWYDRDGSLFAPPGGMEIPGRFMGRSSNTSPEQIYRLVSEYRECYPSMALLHSFSDSRQQIWAFLIAGGSMLRTSFIYPDALPPNPLYTAPANYIPPTKWPLIQPTYEFINTYLRESLPGMKPNHYIVADKKDVWAIGEKGKEYLIYMLHGGALTLGLPKSNSNFIARWFNPDSGEICQMKEPVITGRRVSLIPPSGKDTGQDWVLWLVRESDSEKNVKKQSGFPTCGGTEYLPSFTTTPIVSKDKSGTLSPECFRHDIGAMLKINFQPSGLKPPKGYFEDNGKIFGNRDSLRFGWLSDQSDRMIRRWQSSPARHKPDIRLETVCDVSRNAVWEIEVENGDYLVSITAGDSDYPSYCTVDVEGISFWDAKTLYTDEFATLEKRVTVTDGRLTVTAQGGEQHSTKLSSITIIAAVAEPPSIQNKN